MGYINILERALISPLASLYANFSTPIFLSPQISCQERLLFVHDWSVALLESFFPFLLNPALSLNRA